MSEAHLRCYQASMMKHFVKIVDWQGTKHDFQSTKYKTENQLRRNVM